jgi:hypothetical protein
MSYKNNINVCVAFVLFITLVSCASCRPNGIPRPDSPTCTVAGGVGECTDARGDYTLPERDLICTSLDGYLVLERYVDELEKEVIRLRRRCNQ